MLKKRWAVGAIAVAVPLLLFAVLVQRASWRPVIHKLYPRTISTLNFSSDGKFLTAVGYDLTDQLRATLLSAQTLNQIRVLAVSHSKEPFVFAPNYKAVVTNAGGVNSYGGIYLPDYHLEIHAAATDKLLWTGGHCSADTIKFSTSGHFMAEGAASCGPGTAGDADGAWTVWRIKGFNPQKTVLDNSDQVQAIAFAPDERSVVAGLRDGTLKLWSTESDKLLRKLNLHMGGQDINDVQAVAFSPTGKMIASGHLDNTVWLWDVVQGKPLQTLRGHAKTVQSVAFSPDGNILASGSDDGTIKLWQTQTGQELRSLKLTHSIVMSLAFAPDGNTLASSYNDGTVALWRIK